jgi:ubiquinone/menaquinone biosynthesis C-methylase UbiE
MDNSRSLGFTEASIPEGYERFLLRQLFDPWARELVEHAYLQPGWSVLDVASGLGPVARRAAAVVGPAGRVVASDISEPMLALAAARPVQAGWAPIEYLPGPASAIAAPDDSFDAVLCQHGVQFFADRAMAIGEMYRVARPGGELVLSAWAAERPLGLYGPMGETLQELGVAEPFPRAFDAASYRLGSADMKDLLRTAGFRDVQVRTIELEARWDSTETAASTLAGTPFGPLVSALPGDAQDQVRNRLITKLGGSDDGVTVRTASNIARGIK